MTILRHDHLGGEPSIDGIDVVGGSALVMAWLAGRIETTRTSYAGDLAAFARWGGAEGVGDAVAALLGCGQGEANAHVYRWRGAMIDGGLAPATVNRRLSAVRSLVRFGRRIGLVTWSLDVEGVRHVPYRDTRGPSVQDIAAMLACLPTTAIGLRDHALVRVLFDRGLRVSELCALDLEDVDLRRERLHVCAKGHTQHGWTAIAGATSLSLQRWLQARGTWPGPLFTALDRAHPGHRLTRRSAGRIVARAAKRAGVAHVAPHGLRHAAITVLLDVTNGNVRQAQRFSRHSRLETLALYDDRRRDAAGDDAALVANALTSASAALLQEATRRAG